MIKIIIDGDISISEIDQTIFELHLMKHHVRQELHKINSKSLKEHIEEEKLNEDMRTYEHIFDKKKD